MPGFQAVQAVTCSNAVLRCTSCSRLVVGRQNKNRNNLLHGPGPSPPTIRLQSKCFWHLQAENTRLAACGLGLHPEAMRCTGRHRTKRGLRGCLGAVAQACARQALRRTSTVRNIAGPYLRGWG